MRNKLAELERRRQILVARSAMQRERLADAYRRMQRPLKIVRGIAGVIQTLKSHPALAMGFTALLFGSRRSKGQGWLGRIVSLFRLLAPLQSWIFKRQH